MENGTPGPVNDRHHVLRNADPALAVSAAGRDLASSTGRSVTKVGVPLGSLEFEDLAAIDGVTSAPQTGEPAAFDRMYVVRVTSTMYSHSMKSVTITIPDELDARAAAEARRRGVSKSELIRLGLTAVMPAVQEVEPDDPWRALSGFGSIDVAVTPGEIDDVVYGG